MSSIDQPDIGGTPFRPRQIEDLGRTAARGALFSGLSQGVKILCTILSIVLIAHILAPEDYGIIAMTAPITGFILIFQDIGLNQATIQSQHLTEEQVNAYFYYNIFASLAIAVLILLLSPLVGLFYDDRRAAFVMAASALPVLLTGVTLQHSALLQREMRFGVLSWIEVVTAVLTVGSTYLFALLLRNYWALYIGSLIGAAVTALLILRADPWRPGRPTRLGTGTAGVHFGANLTGYNLLNFFSRNADNVLIAKMWGAASLGAYDRAYRLMMFPIQNITAPLGRVVLPALSHVQEDRPRFRNIYTRSLRAMSLATVPGGMAAAMCSRDVVMTLLGQQWQDAVPIFFWLSLAAITQPVANATGWLYISTGRTRQMLHWGLISAPTTVLSFAIGLPWGAKGVAAAYFIGQVIRSPLLYFLSTRGTPVRQGDMYAAVIPGLVGGGIAWALITPLKAYIGGVPLIVVAFVTAYAFSIGAQACTRDGRDALVHFGRLFGSIAKRR